MKSQWKKKKLKGKTTNNETISLGSNFYIKLIKMKNKFTKYAYIVNNVKDQR